MDNSFGLKLRFNTPLETHVLHNGREVLVKRDDLAGSYPGPPLGKLRGIAKQIMVSGASVIGVVDRTPHSRNSWAHAYVCNALGKTCIAYGRSIGAYQHRALELGATYIPVEGETPDDVYREAVKRFYSADWEEAHKINRAHWIAPDDCHASELVADARREARLTFLDLCCGRHQVIDTLVIPTGSGGLAAGVILGMNDVEKAYAGKVRIILHAAGSRRSPEYLLGALKRLGVPEGYLGSLEVIKSPSMAPMTHMPTFPANPYYELRAWEWLEREAPSGLTLFWNAGG